MNCPLIKELNNGLKIAFVPYPSVGSITICLRGLAGSNYEDCNEVGVAHLLEHYVTYGSKNYPSANSLRNMITKKGGRVTGTTSRDEVAFLTKTLKEDYETGLEFLSEIFLRPTLSIDNLEKVKGTIYQEIHQNIENPQLYIGRLAYNIMFPNQRASYLNTGDIGQVAKIKHEAIMKFWKKLYKPANFVISASGNVQPKKFIKTVEKYFYNGVDTNTIRTSKPSLAPSKEFLVQVKKRNELGQTHIRIDYIGFKTDDEKKYPALVLSKAMQNELNAELNNTLGVDFYTLNTMSFSSNTYGLFSSYAAVNSEGVQKFFELYNRIISKFKKDLITLDFLDLIKSKIKADFEFSYEKTSLRADLYSELILFDQIERNHKRALQKYLDVLQRNILDIANEIFSQEPKITILDKNLTRNNIIKSFLKSKS